MMHAINYAVKLDWLCLYLVDGSIIYVTFSRVGLFEYCFCRDIFTVRISIDWLFELPLKIFIYLYWFWWFLRVLILRYSSIFQWSCFFWIWYFPLVDFYFLLRYSVYSDLYTFTFTELVMVNKLFHCIVFFIKHIT